MRVAIATEATDVAAHFGRCPAYTLVDIEDGSVVKKEVVENPGHEPGAIPQFLHDRGADQVVCGGMGPRAAEMFAGMGIGVIAGITGGVDTAIDRLLAGTLIGGDSLCTHEEGQECDHDHD